MTTSEEIDVTVLDLLRKRPGLTQSGLYTFYPRADISKQAFGEALTRLQALSPSPLAVSVAHTGETTYRLTADASMLPCPFCGEKATYDQGQWIGQRATISCRPCGVWLAASGPVMQAVLIERWNRRSGK